MNERMFAPELGPDTTPQSDAPETEIGFADTLNPETDIRQPDLGSQEEIIPTEREMAKAPETNRDLPRFELSADGDTAREDALNEPITETLKSADTDPEDIESVEEISGVRVVDAKELPGGFTKQGLDRYEKSSFGETKEIVDKAGEPATFQYQDLFEESDPPQKSTEGGTLKSQEEPPHDTLQAA
jgi:hypothetical protein